MNAANDNIGTMNAKHRRSQRILQAESAEIVRGAQCIGTPEEPVSSLVENRSLAYQSRSVWLLAVFLRALLRFNRTPDEAIDASEHMFIHQALFIQINIPIFLLRTNLFL